MKLTLIKAHTPENSFDGYDPHRHWELVNMSAVDYLKRVVDVGLIYPGKEMADLILNPWRIPWIRDNVKLVGYDYMELVEPKYYHLYAFDNYHDGIDGQLIDDGPGLFVQQVKSYYTNANGKHATADIYEVETEEGGDNMADVKPLEDWKIDAGNAGIDALSAVKGVLSNPDDWKKTLDQPVQQWQLWVMLQRVLEASVVKQGK